MDTRSAPCWHALSSDDAVARLGTSADGLTSEAVALQRSVHGPNSMPQPPRRGPLMRFLLQFHNVLIYVLIASGVVTVLLNHPIDAAVIFGVVIINAIIGFLQEGKAERALEAIQAMLSPSAIVVRDGRQVQVAVEDLVPGDLVLLTSGDRVPADLRLLSARNLRIQEAILTGESLPVDKSITPVGADAALAERSCVCFSGTMVVAGRGTGVVVATGGATEIGRISRLLAGVETLETPLLRQMAAFGRWLAGIILAVSAVVLAFAIFWRGQPADDAFLAVVGLAVAAIPEGLPAVMTITLAISVTRMAGRNAIVRRLPAVETLGSVTVICTDKTGTLTRNEMTVRSMAVADGLWAVSGEGYGPVGDIRDEGGATVPATEGSVLADMARGAVLCADADVAEKDGVWTISGDPTEAALLSLALKTGLDLTITRGQFPRLDAIPFESAHRFMASLHHDHRGHVFLYLKGAPEAVLPRCATLRQGAQDVPLDHADWHRRAGDMAARGERVLALAVARLPDDQGTLTLSDVENGLTLLGLFGLIDPPRGEAIAAIAHVEAAGVLVKMITGDHAVTARAIGTQLGLDHGTPLTGRDLDAMDATAFQKAAIETAVFARTAPEHKLRLVEALQAAGHVVAMTGDGVNDAPALKRADVGVAMGCKGTEAAKEAAEMVLADDNFASIAAAVEEGRTVYDNLKKAILFILPTNAGEAFVVIIAILFGLVMPLTTKQILWVNMITAVTLALALGFEAAEKGIMQRPPRPRDEALLSSFLVWRVVFVSILLTAATMGVFQWEMLRTNGDQAVARTAAVNMLVAGEIVYLWNVRYLSRTVLSPEGLFGSPPVMIAAGLVSGFQLVFTYWQPFHRLFDTADLGLRSWLVIGSVALVVFLLVEAEKAIIGGLNRRRQARPR